MDSKQAMAFDKASNTWREAYKAYCAGVSHNKFGNTHAAATVIQSAFAEELAAVIALAEMSLDSGQTIDPRDLMALLGVQPNAG